MNEALSTIENIMNMSDCLFDNSQVNTAINKMSQSINHDLKDLNPVVISVMNGGLVFAGQLLTQLNFPLRVDYCHATRYRGKLEGTELHWKVMPQFDLRGQNILLLDDIYDEGHTLMAIIESLKAQQVSRIDTAILVNKIHDRKADPEYTPDYVGLEVPDRYVFGYGMDYKEFWRNAPGIFAVKQE
ncbi:MAG: hypoxanthine-guanine phosphoribosyltransferase [Gammaproteobacteria bacterium]|nr:hypoxanthine-guanine phosphoribosyltransferase [Gammaproteobacteria bacterium]